MEELQRNLLKVLKRTPQTRADLCLALGISDRKLRSTVQELRDSGYNIASNSNSGGYLLGSERDKRRIIAEYRSRAYKELATASAIERGPLEGQIDSLNSNDMVEDWR